MLRRPESTEKGEGPLMMPIERSRKEIRREKNRLAQRRHREAKRRAMQRTPGHDRQGQKNDNASALDENQPKDLEHNGPGSMGLDYLGGIGSISDPLDPTQMEKIEIIEDLANLNSSWDSHFYHDDSVVNQPVHTHTTSETAATGFPAVTMGSNQPPPSRHSTASDITHWRRDSRCSSPPRLQASDRSLIPVSQVVGPGPPTEFGRYRHQPHNSELTSVPGAQPPGMKETPFPSEAIDNQREFHFHEGIESSRHHNNCFRTFSDEIGAAIAQPQSISPSRSRRKRQKTSHDPTEKRLEKVLLAIEEAGYESLDAVATDYYTLRFPKDTLLASEQFHSRSRRLGTFLNEVHQSTKAWSKREAASYRDVVIRAAEDLFQEEVKSRKIDSNGYQANDGRRNSVCTSTSSALSPLTSSNEEPIIPNSVIITSPQEARVSAYTAVHALLRERELGPILMQDMSRLQNTVSTGNIHSVDRVSQNQRTAKV
ncbi:hypothetical protein FQN53_004429 [Emmonsiellopsis sp. PD_33]|nr:hypothetical protein FQN53_004429 [Emmonsiellopsis sp. PD_33]